MTCGDQFRALENGKIDLGFVDYESRSKSADCNFDRLPRTKPSRRWQKAIPWQRNQLLNSETWNPRSSSVCRESLSGLSLWLTTTCQQVGFTPKFSRIRILNEHSFKRWQRAWCRSFTRSGQKTAARECRVPAIKSNSRDRIVHGMESRKSFCCAQSLCAHRERTKREHALTSLQSAIENRKCQPSRSSTDRTRVS